MDLAVGDPVIVPYIYMHRNGYGVARAPDNTILLIPGAATTTVPTTLEVTRILGEGLAKAKLAIPPQKKADTVLPYPLTPDIEPR